MHFHTALIDWYNKSYRDLPWRNTKDPYLIYLSEIILQQTRVEQGMPYFEKFKSYYPTVKALAAAPEREILKHWQGLGYYSRARNMHSTAKTVATEYGGKFPESYQLLLKLKGVGPYTAAAIASFAFDLPYPVLDGNVERVISRCFGIGEDVRSAAGKQKLHEALNEVFPKAQPALFNQAIMELGSLVCTPKNPQCAVCPLQPMCKASEEGTQASLPYKASKTKVKAIDFHYLVCIQDDRCFIEQRKIGIWQQLHQFPLLEGNYNANALLHALKEHFKSETKMRVELRYQTQHILSHRKIKAHFYTITSDSPIKSLKRAIFEIGMNELGDRYPVPVLIDKFMKHNLEHGK